MRESKDALVIGSADQLFQTKTRRDFLRLLGVGGSVVLLPTLFACDDDDDDDDDGLGPGGQSVVINLANDVGILNYAYALEQLEAAFYTALVANTTVFNAMTVEQQEVIADLRNHEVIHREFFRAAIPAGNRIPDLQLSATAVAGTMSDVATALKSAEMFEDLGVSAYNGAGKYLQNADYLLVAGKIVSVEARHASAIRDLRDSATARPGTAAFTRFAGDDVVAVATGLDVKLEPANVLGRIPVGLIDTTLTPVSATGTPNGFPSTEAPPPSPTP